MRKYLIRGMPHTADGVFRRLGVAGPHRVLGQVTQTLLGRREQRHQPTTGRATAAERTPREPTRTSPRNTHVAAGAAPHLRPWPRPPRHCSRPPGSRRTAGRARRCRTASRSTHRGRACMTAAIETSTVPARPLRQVLGNRTLRRLHYALIGSVTGRFLFVIALGVYTYREGGAALVGVAGFLRLAPGAVIAPFASPLVDRYRKEVVMALCDFGRALLLGLAALAIVLDAGPAVVLIFATLGSALSTLFEPARAALLPTLVDTPEQLTAANVVGSLVNSIGYFIAPALGGLLLVATTPQAVFAITAGVLVWSAACVLSLHPPPQTGTEPAVDGETTSLWAEAREGFAVVAQDRGVTVLIGLLGVQVFLAGAVSVFVVVVALDTLAAGASWVGYLSAAAGVGSLLGTVVVLRLATRFRLSTGTLIGLVLWSVPLLLAAFVDTRIAALSAWLLIGIGDTVIDVSTITLLQRIVPEALLGRIFGVLETVIVMGMGVGALAAPVLISLVGLEGALVVLGLAVPVTALAAAPVLRALDGRAKVTEHPRALLRGVSMFRPLPLPTLDALALALRPVSVPDLGVVFRQGEPGDLFYVIDVGAVDVVVDGEVIERLGAGSAFGEIALLRDVPRTATIVSCGPTELVALERHEFLGAITGHDKSSRAADSLASARLTRTRPALASA